MLNSFVFFKLDFTFSLRQCTAKCTILTKRSSHQSLIARELMRRSNVKRWSSLLKYGMQTLPPSNPHFTNARTNILKDRHKFRDRVQKENEPAGSKIHHGIANSYRLVNTTMSSRNARPETEWFLHYYRIVQTVPHRRKKKSFDCIESTKDNPHLSNKWILGTTKNSKRARNQRRQATHL